MKRQPKAEVTVLIAATFVALCLSGCGKSGAGTHTEGPAGAGHPSPFATIANGKVDIEGREPLIKTLRGIGYVLKDR